MKCDQLQRMKMGLFQQILIYFLFIFKQIKVKLLLFLIFKHHIQTTFQMSSQMALVFSMLQLSQNSPKIEILKANLIKQFIQQQMRLRSTNNSKPFFYRGISLEDYVRKSPNLFLEQQSDQTIIMDQFSQPMINSEDYEYMIHKKLNHARKESQELQTKDSMTLGPDQDMFLGTLQFRNSAKEGTNISIFQRKASRIFNKDKKKNSNCELPPITLSKSKKLRKSIFNDQQSITKSRESRQKCMASRQVSQQSEDQVSSVKKRDRRALSHRQANEHLNKVLQFKRNMSVNRSGAIVVRVKINDLGKLRLKQDK